MTSHIKEFWKFTKSLRKTNTYPSFMTLNGVNAQHDDEIAEPFKGHVSSVYGSDHNVLPPQYYSYANSSLSLIQFNETQILSCIESLDTDKGPGCDIISNFFVVNAAASLVKPLTIIFNASVAQGVFPSRFKETLVHPIFKSGSSDDITNYRPVAILNCFAKIFEKLVHAHLLHHVSLDIFKKNKTQMPAQKWIIWHLKQTFSQVLAHFMKNPSHSRQDEP